MDAWISSSCASQSGLLELINSIKDATAADVTNGVDSIFSPAALSSNAPLSSGRTFESSPHLDLGGGSLSRADVLQLYKEAIQQAEKLIPQLPKPISEVIKKKLAALRRRREELLLLETPVRTQWVLSDTADGLYELQYESIDNQSGFFCEGSVSPKRTNKGHLTTCREDVGERRGLRRVPCFSGSTDIPASLEGCNFILESHLHARSKVTDFWPREALRCKPCQSPEDNNLSRLFTSKSNMNNILVKPLQIANKVRLSLQSGCFITPSLYVSRRQWYTTGAGKAASCGRYSRYARTLPFLAPPKPLKRESPGQQWTEGAEVGVQTGPVRDVRKTAELLELTRHRRVMSTPVGTFGPFPPMHIFSKDMCFSAERFVDCPAANVAPERSGNYASITPGVRQGDRWWALQRGVSAPRSHKPDIPGKELFQRKFFSSFGHQSEQQLAQKIWVLESLQVAFSRFIDAALPNGTFTLAEVGVPDISPHAISKQYIRFFTTGPSRLSHKDFSILNVALQRKTAVPQLVRPHIFNSKARIALLTELYLGLLDALNVLILDLVAVQGASEVETRRKDHGGSAAQQPLTGRTSCPNSNYDVSSSEIAVLNLSSSSLPTPDPVRGSQGVFTSGASASQPSLVAANEEMKVSDSISSWFTKRFRQVKKVFAATVNKSGETSKAVNAMTRGISSAISAATKTEKKGHQRVKAKRSAAADFLYHHYLGLISSTFTQVQAVRFIITELFDGFVYENSTASINQCYFETQHKSEKFLLELKQHIYNRLVIFILLFSYIPLSFVLSDAFGMQGFLLKDSIRRGLEIGMAQVAPKVEIAPFF